MASAQINVTVDASENWIGFINVFNLDNTFADNGFSYPVADLRTDVNTVDNSVSVFPNFLIWDLNDDTPGTGPFDAEWNSYWFSSPGVPDKNVELNSFVERNRTANPDFFNQDITFDFAITEFGLTAPQASDYTIKGFIKVFPGDFSSVRQYDVTLSASGTFSVTAPASEFVAADQFIQWGFQVYGPIGDDELEPARAFGGVRTVDPASLSTNDFQDKIVSVSPNPTNNTWNIEANTSIDAIEVFDLLGKNVISLSPNSQNVSIDASSLRTGVYLARVTANGATKSLKLVRN